MRVDRKHVPLFFVALAVLVTLVNVVMIYIDRNTSLTSSETIFRVWLSAHNTYPFIFIVYCIPVPIAIIVYSQKRDDLTKIDWIKKSYAYTVFMYSGVSLLMYFLLQFAPNTTRTFNVVDFIILNLNYLFVSTFITSVSVFVVYYVDNVVFSTTLVLMICVAVDRLAALVYLANVSIIRADNTLIVALLPYDQPILVNIFAIYSAVLSLVAMNFFVVFGDRS